MAKRMTDTEKWNKRWFRTLPPKFKLMWNYLCDTCDAAGVWSEDYELASFRIGLDITRDEFMSAFGDKVQRLSADKVFLPAFIEFQYGTLSEDCKPHASVIKLLIKAGIDPQTLTLSKGYAKGFQTLKEKEKEKEKDKETEKEKEKDSAPVLNFETLWKKYPRHVDKTEAAHRFKRLIKTPAAYEALSKAIDRYRQYCIDRHTEEQHIKHFASFLGTEDKQRWRDWLETETGQPVLALAGGKTGIDWSRVWHDDEQGGDQ